MAVTPNIDCSCGQIVHPDMPNVVADMDDPNVALWHEDEHGWHEIPEPTAT